MQAIFAVILTKESFVRLALALILHDIHILHEFGYIFVLFLAILASLHTNHWDCLGRRAIVIDLIINALGRGASLR